MSWKARHSMSLHVKLRYILKAVSAAVWAIVLPIAYAYSWKNPSGFSETIRSWFGNSPSSPSFFIVAILLYLSPNMLSAVLFLFPFIRRYLERSDNKVLRLIMWWSQVCRDFRPCLIVFLSLFVSPFWGIQLILETKWLHFVDFWLSKSTPSTFLYPSLSFWVLKRFQKWRARLYCDNFAYWLLKVDILFGTAKSGETN